IPGIFRFIRFTICVLLVGVGTAVAMPGPAAADPSEPPAPCVSEVEAESSALEMAQRCGERVEVLAARTERTQTFAEPTGVMTWESALMTERVKRPDGSWAAVDLTLRELEGGQLAPVASPVDMRFSPGGEGPFAEWRRGG